MFIILAIVPHPCFGGVRSGEGVVKMDEEIYSEGELSLLIAESTRPGKLPYRVQLVDPDFNLDPETMTFTPAQIAERDKANVESLKKWGGV